VCRYVNYLHNGEVSSTKLKWDFIEQDQMQTAKTNSKVKTKSRIASFEDKVKTSFLSLKTATKDKSHDIPLAKLQISLY